MRQERTIHFWQPYIEEAETNYVGLISSNYEIDGEMLENTQPESFIEKRWIQANIFILDAWSS